MNETQDQKEELSTAEDEEFYISKVHPEQRVLEYISELRMHRLTLMLHRKPKGISCNICKTPIELGYNYTIDEEERIYFCPKMNIFMHKVCLCKDHKTEDVCTQEEPEHSDYAVYVDIQIKEALTKEAHND